MIQHKFLDNVIQNADVGLQQVVRKGRVRRQMAKVGRYVGYLSLRAKDEQRSEWTQISDSPRMW